MMLIVMYLIINTPILNEQSCGSSDGFPRPLGTRGTGGGATSHRCEVKEAEHILMWLDKSKLIDRWRCDATWALKATYRRLFTVSRIMIDSLNDWLKPF